MESSGTRFMKFRTCSLEVRGATRTHQIPIHNERTFNSSKIRCCRKVKRGEAKNYEFKKELVERRITNPEKRLPVLSHIKNSFLCPCAFLFFSFTKFSSTDLLVVSALCMQQINVRVLVFQKVHKFPSVGRVANRSIFDIKKHFTQQ